MTPEIDTLENKKSASPVKDPVPIKAVHHVELWVGNAKQATYYYRNAFGFSQLAWKRVTVIMPLMSFPKVIFASFFQHLLIVETE